MADLVCLAFVKSASFSVSTALWAVTGMVFEKISICDVGTPWARSKFTSRSNDHSMSGLCVRASCACSCCRRFSERPIQRVADDGRLP